MEQRSYPCAEWRGEQCEGNEQRSTIAITVSPFHHCCPQWQYRRKCTNEHRDRVTDRILKFLQVWPINDPKEIRQRRGRGSCGELRQRIAPRRSEEHTSELQSQSNLVCRLLLEKKNKRVTLASSH